MNPTPLNETVEEDQTDNVRDTLCHCPMALSALDLTMVSFEAESLISDPAVLRQLRGLKSLKLSVSSDGNGMAVLRECKALEELELRVVFSDQKEAGDSGWLSEVPSLVGQDRLRSLKINAVCPDLAQQGEGFKTWMESMIRRCARLQRFGLHVGSSPGRSASLIRDFLSDPDLSRRFRSMEECEWDARVLADAQGIVETVRSLMNASDRIRRIPIFVLRGDAERLSALANDPDPAIRAAFKRIDFRMGAGRNQLLDPDSAPSSFNP